VNNASWLIQVYEMADLAAQQSAVSLLSSIPVLTVDARTRDSGSYVAVECADAIHALAVYELVMMADPHAELVHSTTSTTEMEAVWQRVRPETASSSDGELLDA
jgi:hypothetical protein